MALFLALILALIPSCAGEDSSNCYWDASAHGNGIGRSFIDIGGAPYYLP